MPECTAESSGVASLSHVQEPGKRRSASASGEGAEIALNAFAEPTLSPITGQAMSSFFQRLRSVIDGTRFEKKDNMSEEGLYIHKRHIRGDHGKMLEQAGTALQHTLIYVKTADKVVAMDYGPQGSADVTENLLDSVPCGPVLHDPAEPEQESQSLPYLHLRAPFHSVDSPPVREAISFVEGRQYNALSNNCIQNTDFLVRVLTGGAVRNAPLIFDALCGHVPPQDNPMLLMFMLMTRMSWFDVCDGGRISEMFLKDHACPSVPDADTETAQHISLRPDSVQHNEKAQKHSIQDTPKAACREKNGLTQRATGS